MSNNGAHRGVRTVTMSWRRGCARACAVIPAVALIGGGIALPAPARDSKPALVSRISPAIVVPGTALTMPPAGNRPRPPNAPALVLPEGTVPGSSAPMTLDTTGIPVRALQAYRLGAALTGAADPACHLDWALLAAIGRVESDHARFGGNQLDSAGIARPGIIGIALDGSNGTARILDTDGGRLDGDTTYDRAVGPMQFIPGTWRVVGVDADGRGVKNPQDMADAVTATGVYLCSGTGDLTRPGDLRAAILRYNPSDSYARTVTAIADAYRHGVSALPAADLPAASSASPRPGTTHPAATSTKAPSSSRPAPRSTPRAAQPVPATPSGSPSTTAPASPASPTPALPLPGPVPSLPAPPVPSVLPSPLPACLPPSTKDASCLVHSP